MITDIQKKRIVGGVLAFLAVISLYFIAKLINEIRTGQYIGTKDTPSTITVNGDGEVYATADIATISFTARGQGSTVKIAQEKETAIINKAVDYLKEKGIAEKDIKTSNYNLQPQYDYGNCSSGYCPTRTPKISGYDASQTVDIKIRDIDTVGDILTGLGAAGVTELSGPNFTIDNQDELKDEARSMAIKEADEKAKKLARDLGVDIVRVTSFQESTGGYYPMAYDAKAELQSAASGPTANPVIPAGENKILVNVTVTYEIR
jgi:uncharacterized protein YggE